MPHQLHLARVVPDVSSHHTAAPDVGLVEVSRSPPVLAFSSHGIPTRRFDAISVHMAAPLARRGRAAPDGATWRAPSKTHAAREAAWPGPPRGERRTRSPLAADVAPSWHSPPADPADAIDV